MVVVLAKSVNPLFNRAKDRRKPGKIGNAKGVELDSRNRPVIGFVAEFLGLGKRVTVGSVRHNIVGAIANAAS